MWVFFVKFDGVLLEFSSYFKDFLFVLRYNICSKSLTETREICQLILDRVFTPLLENVCEYYEHIANASLEGLNTFNPIGNARVTMYFLKYLCNVPGYVYYESERMQFHDKLFNLMKTDYNERGKFYLYTLAPEI